MRIKLLVTVGQHKAGEVIDVGYTAGANLCYFGHAEEVKDIVVSAIEEPPKDKMIRKPETRRKRGRPRKVGPDNGNDRREISRDGSNKE